MSATQSPPLPVWAHGDGLKAMQHELLTKMRYDSADVPILAVVAIFMRTLPETEAAINAAHSLRMKQDVEASTALDDMHDAISMDQSVPTATTSPITATAKAAPPPRPWDVRGPKVVRESNYYTIEYEIVHKRIGASAVVASVSFDWLRRLQEFNRILPNEPIQTTRLESRNGVISFRAHILFSANCAQLPPNVVRAADTESPIEHTLHPQNQLPEYRKPRLLVKPHELPGLCRLLQQYEAPMMGGRNARHDFGPLNRLKENDVSLVASALRSLQAVVLRNRSRRGQLDSHADMGDGAKEAGFEEDAADKKDANLTVSEQAFRAMLELSTHSNGEGGIFGNTTMLDMDYVDWSLSKDGLRCCVTRTNQMYTVAVIARNMTITWDDVRDLQETASSLCGLLWLRMYPFDATMQTNAAESSGGLVQSTHMTVLSVGVPMLQYVGWRKPSCDGPSTGMGIAHHGKHPLICCVQCTRRACLSRQTGDKATMTRHKDTIPRRRADVPGEDVSEIAKYRMLLFPASVMVDEIEEDGGTRGKEEKGHGHSYGLRRSERRRTGGGGGGGGGGRIDSDSRASTVVGGGRRHRSRSRSQSDSCE